MRLKTIDAHEEIHNNITLDDFDVYFNDLI